jgi:GTP diphosphokinase / guanosine-3',5'-bis(diphosphate) 3'-diphosphatase
VITLHQITQELTQYHPDADLDIVNRAYVFSARSHKGQTRKSGEPYIMHPLEVGLLVAGLHLDAPSVCAGLLHDTVEDTDATIDDIRYQFGSEIANLVESLTKLNKINFQNHAEAQAANFRKMLLAMSRDMRVILIKLSDRLHNMRTLGNLSLQKRQRIARETIDIYAPLASRLGLYRLKIEMEDLCFKNLYPEDYHHVAELLQQSKKDRESYIAMVINELHAYFSEQKVEATVHGRPKHLWSIWQKMKRTGGGLDTLYDVLAFRIIVPKISLCYEVLGLIHSVWKPIPGRFKDYIALPKSNGYQSLHTAVFGPNNERIEVQIRTQEMHESSELGVAAHWAYKEHGKGKKRKHQPMTPDETFVWLRQLLEWQRDLKDPNDFLQAVRIDLFDEEVYVFTPQGEVIPLPRGATPIDFAYSIHSDLGNECTGAMVNGKIVNLRYELQNGDIVNIVRTKGSHPKADWLNVVKTGKAATRIRVFHRAEANEQSVLAGITLLESELKKHNYSLNRLRKESKMEKMINHHKMGSERELMMDLGYGKLDVAKALEPLFPNNSEAVKVQQKVNFNDLQQQTPPSKISSNAILVDGEEGMAVHYPQCCSPIPGDEVTGFVTLGRGVTIHRNSCPHCLDYDPSRRVNVGWKQGIKSHRSVGIRIFSSDAKGLLASISAVLHKSGVNITAVNCQTTEEHRAINDFTINIKNLEQLQELRNKLKQIEGITEVERITH